MKKFITPLFFLILIPCCSNNKTSYNTIESVINANLDYSNKEDLDGVMSTLDKNMPNYSEIKNFTKQIFDVYDLNYKLEKIEIIEQNSNDAKVKFVQLTTKLKGPEFRDNRLTGIHTLKRNGNSWKIYDTKIINIDYLN